MQEILVRAFTNCLTKAGYLAKLPNTSRYRFQLEEDDEEYHISRMKGANLTFLVMSETITDADLDRGSIGLMISPAAIDFDNIKVEGEPAAVSVFKLAAL